MSVENNEYLRVVASLETNELSVLYRQTVNGDPAGLTRKGMLAALENAAIPDDFHRQVGEIKAMVAGLQGRAGSDDDQLPEKRQPGLLDPDESVFSSQPGKWQASMSVGPNRTETANRVKWARLLYQEQKRPRIAPWRRTPSRLVQQW